MKNFDYMQMKKKNAAGTGKLRIFMTACPGRETEVFFICAFSA